MGVDVELTVVVLVTLKSRIGRPEGVNPADSEAGALLSNPRNGAKFRSVGFLAAAGGACEPWTYFDGIGGTGVVSSPTSGLPSAGESGGGEELFGLFLRFVKLALLFSERADTFSFSLLGHVTSCSERLVLISLGGEWHCSVNAPGDKSSSEVGHGESYDFVSYILKSKERKLASC